MNYIIECRPSGQLIKSMAADDHLRPLAELLASAVFFACNISCEAGPNIDDMRRSADEIVHQASKAVAPSLIVETERIEARESSVVLIFYINVLVTQHPEPATAAAVVGLGSLAVWALPKLWDAVLDKFFRALVDQTTERIAAWWRGNGKEPPKIDVVDPAFVADAEAANRARAHGCSPALLSGGFVVGPHRYKYVYQLAGCNKTRIAVIVDSQAEAPPQVEIW
jgi:hypothetical protein